MTRRQAMAYQHPDGAPQPSSQSFHGDDDLERHAEEAARRAGKTVEEWLHDLILDQSAPQPIPTPNAHRQPTQQDEWKREAILSDLADRVNALEGSFDTPGAPLPTSSYGRAMDGAAAALNNNHDEDARTLIEGIRARAHQKNTYQAPSQAGPLTAARAHPDVRPQPQDDQANRLMGMLDTISFLEQRIKGAAPQPSAPGEPQADAQKQDDRLSQITEKLAMLEKSLEGDADASNKRAPQKGERGKRRDQARARHGQSQSMAEPVQGRRAMRETMQAIADRETGTRFNGMTYVPKNRPARTAPRRKEADRHYQTLVTKLDEIREGTPSIAAIQALKDEFANLRDVVNRDAQKGTKTEIKRLRNALYKMQNQITSAFDDTRLHNLEGDVNRIAEYLLTSQPNDQVAPDFTALYQEFARLSDGLVAATDRAEAAARDNGNLVALRIEDGLANLRDDVARQLRDSAAGAPVPQ
ncbi:MAG: hypothetical protein AAGJ85_04775, partial [Pseudomonadota bacterium]